MIELADVSFAVIVCPPAVFSVAEKAAVPFVSGESAGRTALLSELVKCTVPEYVVAGLLAASSAVTPKVKAVPARAVGK